MLLGLHRGGFEPTEKSQETHVSHRTIGVDSNERLVTTGREQQPARVRGVAEVDVAHGARPEAEPRHRQLTEPVTAGRRRLGRCRVEVHRRPRVSGQLAMVAQRQLETQHRHSGLQSAQRHYKAYNNKWSNNFEKRPHRRVVIFGDSERIRPTLTFI